MIHKGTILELYTELYRKPDRWKYYSNFPQEQYSLETILNDGYTAQRFIQEYFQYGGKNSIVNDISNYCKPDRAVHSISTFFLGILLMPIFIGQCKNRNVPFDNFFLWLWFLTCLYHDMAYKFEDDKTYIPTLNKFMSDKNIEYKIFGNKKIRLKGVSKNTVRAYYNYRIKECKCVDHGIIGGQLLYDSLRKNYKKTYDDHCSNCNYNDFTWNNLHFSESHFQLYEKCANAIIQHNIWFVSKMKDNEYKKYLDYSLKDLTYLPSCKPKYKDWLTALLVLCDTIEPIKRFPPCNSSQLLQNIIIEYEETGAYIKINFTDACMNNLPYIRGVVAMSEWTEVSVISPQDSLLISNIKNLYQ